MSKKVLLTNFSMKNFTGSEIDTLTIANYFLTKKYEVTIFSLVFDLPLLNNIDDRIQLIDFEKVDKLDKKYDLVWSHHYPLLDYILFTLKIKADYIHYLSLSGYVDLEAFPNYYKDLSMVSILSMEAKNQCAEEGYDVSKIQLFSNYAPMKYFHKIRMGGGVENLEK